MAKFTDGSPLAGDFDNDGNVNAADYVVWRKNGGTQQDFDAWRANFGQSTVTPLPGDFNADGHVDAADYVVWRKSNGSSIDYNTWRSHFGQPGGSALGAAESASASAAVPEPSSLALAAVALFSFHRMGRIKRGRESYPY